MNDVQEKRFPSGVEVLEHYVPDYVDPEANIEDDFGEPLNGAHSTNGLSDKILSDLQSKIDNITVKKN